MTGCHTFGGRSGHQKQVSTPEEKLLRVVRRARKKIRCLTRFNACRYLWTLTRRGGMPSYDEALRFWKKFCRIVKRSYPDFGAVAVPEVHKGGLANDGTYHIHFAVREFYEVKVLRAAWYRCVGFTPEGKTMGQVDAKAPPRGVFDPYHISNYLMKYISKEIVVAVGDRSRFEHYYWVTKSFCPPDLNRKENREKKFGYRSVCDYGGGIRDRESRLLGLLFFLTGKKVRVKWRSEDGRDFRFATVDELDYAETG